MDSRHPAPWPNATPEESRAYSEQASLGDADFEREVVSNAPPQVAPYVDADRATYLGPESYNLRGFYTPPHLYVESDKSPSGKMLNPKVGTKRYSDLMAKYRNTNPRLGELEADTVYALGTGAEPNIWAHEFGHRMMEHEKLSPLMGEERSIQVMQAFYARTPFEWASSVRAWYTLNKRKQDYENYQQVEDHLLSVIDSWKDTIIDSEVEARKTEGDNPKDRKTFFGLIDSGGSLRKDAEEGYEKRKNHWSVDRYNKLVDQASGEPGQE